MLWTMIDLIAVIFSLLDVRRENKIFILWTKNIINLNYNNFSHSWAEETVSASWHGVAEVAGLELLFSALIVMQQGECGL